MSFDRAADYYDATRRLPDSVRDQLAELLADELVERGLCVEIGVGTGRIALPLHRRGVTLIGTDIARAMVLRLVANAGGRQPFPVLLAAAAHLPLPDSSTGAVLASHVLHLIPDWRSAVDEAMRVLHPGGTLLIDFGGWVRAPWSVATEQIFRRHGIERIRLGASSHQEVADHLTGSAVLRPLSPLPMTVRRTLRKDIEEWEGQIQSWTWPYSAPQIGAACADVRTWAAERTGSLDEEVRMESTIQWWAFDRR